MYTLQKKKRCSSDVHTCIINAQRIIQTGDKAFNIEHPVCMEISFKAVKRVNTHNCRLISRCTTDNC